MGKREEIREKRQREQRRNLVVGTLVIAGVVILITAMVILRSQTQIQSIITPAAFDFPQNEGMAMGDPDAPVVIEEFSDFQCPACQFFHEETLEQVVDEYVRTGDVYYIFRPFPFIGKESQVAALGGYCAAEQGLFWEYSNIVFTNQIGENAEVLPPRDWKRWQISSGWMPTSRNVYQKDAIKTWLTPIFKLLRTRGSIQHPAFLSMVCFYPALFHLKLTGAISNKLS